MPREPSRRTDDDPNAQRSPFELMHVPAAAWDRFLDRLKSEPLSLQELASQFSVGRNKVRAILDKIPGVERVPGGWRVPLVRMPPAYLVSLGLLSPRG